MSEKLIYGKSNIERIVGIEINDDEAEIFIQLEDGNVVSTTHSNKFWILSDSNLNGKFIRLNGNLHYKYGTQYLNRKDWARAKAIWRDREDIFVINDIVEAKMVKDGLSFYRNLKQKDISLLSFDIETTGIDGKAPDAKLLLISLLYRSVNGIEKKLLSYDDYSSEKEFIEAFCDYVQEKDPSLLIGHNIIGYDFPYLRDRAAACKAKLRLGRYNKEIYFNSWESKFRLDGTRDLQYFGVNIYGREIVDTFMLAISFDVSKSIETYALKPMIKQLGFEKEGRQFYDAGQIRNQYKNPEEWKKIKQYAEDDAEDPVKLWDYMGPLYFNMAPMIPKSFTKILQSASGSKINAMMIRAYLQDGHSIPKASEARKYQGALSFAVSGIYNNCFKIDLAALYPSIMLQFEVFDDEKDPKAYLLELVRIFRTKRLEYKKLAADTGDSYWQEMDTTAKSILNSFYGFLGTTGLIFNSPSCAEFITGKGREILEYTIGWATGMSESEIKTVTNQDEEVEEVEE